MEELQAAMVGARLTEDEVRYQLYLLDPKFGQPLVSESELTATAASYLSSLHSDLHGYIWQKDSFNLKVVSGKEGAPSHYLFGSTRYGDNNEDEWFIVHLLLKLTAQDKNLVAAVCDNDGEFLCIEAADYLPRWLDPDTATNRVFLYGGKVHIVPPEGPYEKGPGPEGCLYAIQGMHAVRDPAVKSEAPEGVQRVISLRTEQFRENPRGSMHTTVCYVPAGVACVLEKDPQLVSAAVEAFYTRDPIELKACSKMEDFPPNTRIHVPVRMTRCLYAQLSRQTNFRIPPLFGASPLANTRAGKAFDLGAKLACGAQILLCRFRKAEAQQKAACEGPAWDKYVAALKARGYFRGEMEGSKLYRELMAQASAYFADTPPADSEQVVGEGDDGKLAAAKMRSLLVGVDVEKYAVEHGKALSQWPADDTDDWLQITPEQLEQMWTSRLGSAAAAHPQTDTDAAMSAANTLHNLSAFIAQQNSDFEGAEVPNDVAMDPERFLAAIQSVLGGRDSQPMKDKQAAGTDPLDDFLGSDTDEDEDEDEDMMGEEDAEMLEYLREMDRQLKGTPLGQSFLSETLKSTQANPSDSGNPSNVKESPAPKMESERQEKSENAKGKEPMEVSEDEDEMEEDENRDVHVDLNMLQNLLQSYGSQQGLAGPVGNLLHSLGLRLPDSTDAEELD